MVLKLTELAELAKQQLAEVTGLRPVAVVGAHRNDEGWHVWIDMLEMVRIPDSTDILGTYVVSLDQEGNMTRFEKKHSRFRGDAYQEEEASWRAERAVSPLG